MNLSWYQPPSRPCQIMIDLSFPVSLFRNYYDPIPLRTIPILDFFTKRSPGLEGSVRRIRATNDKELRDKIKSTLPSITPSGCFSYRHMDFQISHSGFICMDIDKLDKSDVESVKQSIATLPYSCLIGSSVSEKGIFFLSEVATPQFHKEHFDWIARDIKGKLGFTIDPSCSDRSRLRGYTIDDNLIINRNADVVTGRYVEPEAIRESRNNYGGGLDRMRFFQLLRLIEETGIDITSIRQDWIKIGTGIASEFAEEGYTHFEDISRHYKDFSIRECKKQYKSCLKGREKAGLSSVFWVAKNYGVLLK